MVIDLPVVWTLMSLCSLFSTEYRSVRSSLVQACHHTGYRQNSQPSTRIITSQSAIIATAAVLAHIMALFSNQSQKSVPLTDTNISRASEICKCPQHISETNQGKVLSSQKGRKLKFTPNSFKKIEVPLCNEKPRQQGSEEADGGGTVVIYPALSWAVCL